MDTTMSIKRRRLLGAAAASLALPAFTGRARPPRKEFHA